MKELFTYVNITPDAVDFGGQVIYRPDGVGVMQWIDFWTMAKDCRDRIKDLSDEGFGEIARLESRLAQVEEALECAEEELEERNAEICRLETEAREFIKAYKSIGRQND